MADKSSPNPFMDMFQKFGENLKLPGPEITDVVDYHRKNIQAMQDAAQASSAGAQAVMAKQREALEEALAGITDMVQNPGGAENMMTGQAEFARKAFEATMKNTKDISEIMRESGAESADILKKRIEESLEEIRTAMKPGG
ncbi:MAG: TIGR01841 family phasin [Pseudomonadota bacterium]